MDLEHMVMLALQASILGTVFGFGLKTSVSDLLYVLRRPGLLARSLLAVFVIMPVVAVLLVRIFNFLPAVEVVLIALAISPVPPLLPKRESQYGGLASYGLGLMAVLALVAIVAIPAALDLLGLLFGRSLAVAPGAVAGLVLKTTLAPMAAGLAVRAMAPQNAERIEKVVTPLAAALMAIGVVALVIGTASAMWALVGGGTLVAFVLYTLLGLFVGHLLGGPNPDESAVLALSTAYRHPVIALTLATTNFPDQEFGALVLLYLIVGAVAGIPYLMWLRRHAARPVSPA
jgi:BASS family bile acid:Na+ symporter